MAYYDNIHIDGLTEQENRAYRAIEKWSSRLNKYQYHLQTRGRKKLKSFSPSSTSLELLEQRQRMVKHEITAEELMAMLHRADIRTQLNICMEAGY